MTLALTKVPRPDAQIAKLLPYIIQIDREPPHGQVVMMKTMVLGSQRG